MHTNVSCQPNEATFRAPNIRKCERYVRSIQRKLDKAVANDDKAKIRWCFHLLSKRSRAVKIRAVNRITRINPGKTTAGIDGDSLPTDKSLQDSYRHQHLNNVDVEKKPEPIRRVFIPKPNGAQKRPLGIPTVKDRIVQDILRQALEPITEYHFNERSFGFRPKRCCQDAAEDLFKKLSRKVCKRWIVEGDIKGCFDHINHEQILTTLQKWQTPTWAVSSINRMLKSKIFYDGNAFPSEEGTPQGGVISPMLANVALTALDEHCKQYNPRTNMITRYADDFVIVCQSEVEAEFIKVDIAKFLKQKSGLELSDEKTKITHISKGFNFLGFSFRKYDETNRLYGKKPKRSLQLELIKRKIRDRWENHKLIIKPDKKKVTIFLKNCKAVLRTYRTAPQHVVIRKLNEKLRGWGNYHRFNCSSQTFSKVDHEVWWKVYRWAKRRHPNKSKSWVFRRYFSRIGNYKTRFHDKKSKTTMIMLSQILCSKRWIKVRADVRVHEGSENAIEYWQKREDMNAKDSIFGSKTLTELFRSQKGKCSHCEQPITDKQVKNVEIDKHHMKPRSMGGSDKLRNLRLLHSDCHRRVHAILTRIEMSELTDSGINYIRVSK